MRDYCPIRIGPCVLFLLVSRAWILINLQAALFVSMFGFAGVMRPDMAQYLAKGGMDRESAIYKAITRIQSHYRGYAVRKVRFCYMYTR